MMPRFLAPLLALGFLPGCGLVLQNPEKTEWEKAAERRPSSVVVDGEVRDLMTGALIRDAVIEVATDVVDYQPVVTVDEGRFHLRVDALVKRDAAAGEVFWNDEHAYDVTIRSFAYRARAGAPCSPTQWEGTSPGGVHGRVILWVQECTEAQLAAVPRIPGARRSSTD